MKIWEILSSERAKAAKKGIKATFKNYLRSREKILKELNLEELKLQLRKIKETSILNLDEIRKRAAKNLRKNGIKVLEAKSSQEAEKILLKIIRKGEVVAKAKSSTLHEIGLTKLKQRNEVIETDCGDFLVQLLDEKAIHPILPALHLPLEEIVEKIYKKFGVRLKKSPEKIATWASEQIKKEILKAEVGLTGANAISADGAIFILENEGNISLISRLPKKHVVVAGIDKLVSSAEEAITLCRAQAIWGTAASLPTYINVIASPAKTADIKGKAIFGMHGPREVYLILLDNWRSKAIKDGFEELLYCINCGSCLYFCPIYRQIFDRYGLEYLGGRGVGIAVFMNSLKLAFDSGLYFCTTCRACKTNCPLEIDTPELIRKLRKRAVDEKLETEANRRMMENVARDGNPFGKIEAGRIPKELYCC